MEISGKLNQFIKGAAWGLVAFVHLALFTVLTFRFTLNCLPKALIANPECVGDACVKTCASTSDIYFYILAGVTIIDAFLLPLGFGAYWAIKKKS